MSNSLSKKIFIVSFSLLLSFSPFMARNAFAWDAVMGAFAHRALDTVYNTIQGITLGMLKKQAVSALNQEVSFLVTGRSSQGAMFVTDWHDYLIAQPQKQTQLYMNAYIDQATSGRGSLSQYIPAGSEGFGLSGGNYLNSLKVGVQNTIINPDIPKVTYVGDPSRMFAQGNFRNMSLYLFGINNPFAINLYMQQERDRINQENQLIAMEKERAGSGFIGKESNGKTITPGILIKEQIAGVQDLGNKIIAAAQSVPEVISSVVSQMITQSLSQGIGTIQASVHREVGATRSQVTGQMNAAVQQYGPGAQYMQNWAIGR